MKKNHPSRTASLGEAAGAQQAAASFNYKVQRFTSSYQGTVNEYDIYHVVKNGYMIFVRVKPGGALSSVGSKDWMYANVQNLTADFIDYVGHKTSKRNLRFPCYVTGNNHYKEEGVYKYYVGTTGRAFGLATDAYMPAHNAVRILQFLVSLYESIS